MEVKEGAGVADVSQQIVAGLAAAEAEAEVFRRHFTHFSHLWTTPLQDSLQVCHSYILPVRYLISHIFPGPCKNTDIVIWESCIA